MQINDTLVDTHLVSVPGLGTLTARSLTCGDSELLGRHSDRAEHFKLLLFGAFDQVRAHFLQALHIRARQSDTNTMNRDLLFGLFTLFLVGLFFHEKNTFLKIELNLENKLKFTILTLF